jgi:hypothetical protein
MAGVLQRGVRAFRNCRPAAAYGYERFGTSSKQPPGEKLASGIYHHPLAMFLQKLLLCGSKAFHGLQRTLHWLATHWTV